MSTFRYFLALLGIFGPFWHFWTLYWYSTCLGLFSTPVCSCSSNLHRRRNELFLHFSRWFLCAELAQSLPELYWDAPCLISSPLPAAITSVMVWLHGGKRVIGWFTDLYFVKLIATNVSQALVLMKMYMLKWESSFVELAKGKYHLQFATDEC